MALISFSFFIFILKEVDLGLGLPREEPLSSSL